MIDFMLIAAPRSATTWASNWLTTDHSTCLHDPLLKWTKDELMTLEASSSKTLGMACTGIALFPDWVNAHPARKVILHRDLDEIDASLQRIGMTPCGVQWKGVLEKIDGIHLDWTELFKRPRHIYEFLLNLPFDPERWAVLKEINMQPNFGSLSINREATQAFMHELRVH